MSNATLATKMVAAMNSIDAVEKHGKNTFQNYKYVRAADVANEVRKAMIEHGIAFTYDVVGAERWEQPSKKEGGSTMYFCQLTVKCTFTCSQSGETMSGRVIGWGSDTLDKAPFKAMTGAIKYAMRMNFMIPDESDPENDGEDKKLAAARARTPKVDTTSAVDGVADDKQLHKLYERLKEHSVSKEAFAAALVAEGVTDQRKMSLKSYDNLWVWAAEAA